MPHTWDDSPVINRSSCERIQRGLGPLASQIWQGRSTCDTQGHRMRTLIRLSCHGTVGCGLSICSLLCMPQYPAGLPGGCHWLVPPYQIAVPRSPLLTGSACLLLSSCVLLSQVDRTWGDDTHWLMLSSNCCLDPQLYGKPCLRPLSDTATSCTYKAWGYTSTCEPRASGRGWVDDQWNLRKSAAGEINTEYKCDETARSVPQVGRRNTDVSR